MEMNVLWRQEEFILQIGKRLKRLRRNKDAIISEASLSELRLLHYPVFRDSDRFPGLIIPPNASPISALEVLF
jgi:hypothetical protein